MLIFKEIPNVSSSDFDFSTELNREPLEQKAIFEFYKIYSIKGKTVEIYSIKKTKFYSIFLEKSLKSMILF